MDRPEPARAPIARYVALLAAILLSARVITTLVYLVALAPVSVDLEYPEGSVVARALGVAQGGAAYRDWREWPHAFAPYGPLTYQIPGELGKLLKATTPRALYLLGRGQSICALFVALICVYGIARRLGLSPAWACVALAPALGWDKLMTFAVSYRPDMPAVALSLLAFWIALGGVATRRRALTAFTVLWFAFWFKPTGMAMALTLGAWMILAPPASAEAHSKKFIWIRAIVALATFAGSGVALAALINHHTDGLFFLNLKAAANNGYSIEYLRYVLLEGTTPLPGAIMLAGLITAALTAAHSLRKCGRGAPRGDAVITEPAPPANSAIPLALWALAGLLSAAISLAQASKFGANSNYFLEFYLLASVGVALLIHRAWLTLFRRAYFPARPASLSHGLPAVAGVLLGAWLLTDAALALRHAVPDIKIILKARRPPASVRIMADTPGDVLVQTPYLALARPAPPTLMDGVHYAVAIERMPHSGAAPLARSPLLMKIRARDFAVIALSKDDYARALTGERPSASVLFDPIVIAAIQSNYAPAQEADAFIFLRPKR